MTMTQKVITSQKFDAGWYMPTIGTQKFFAQSEFKTSEPRAVVIRIKTLKKRSNKFCRTRNAHQSLSNLSLKGVD
jgi:hypothetical protein